MSPAAATRDRRATKTSLRISKSSLTPPRSATSRWGGGRDETPQASPPLAGAGSDIASRGGISAGELNEKAAASDGGESEAGADGRRPPSTALSESDRGGGGDTAAW